jgi:nucleoside diphosphate kinase
MTSTFLITTPESDDVLYYCSEWSKQIIEEAEKKGFRIANLKQEKSNKKNFEGHVKKQKPVFVMFNGHGMPDFIAGYNDEILLKKGKNEDLMNSKIVYARSCYSLSELGEACAESGAKGFIGYNLPFSFVSDPNRSAHPLKDELASPCMITSNSIPLSILKGQKVVDSVLKAKKKMEELIGTWETRKDLVETPFVASCLHWNKLALGFAGDGNAKV